MAVEEDRVVEVVGRTISEADLASLEKNIRDHDRLTPKVEAALRKQYVQVGRTLVANKTGLDLSDLTPAEEKIVQAVSEYVGLQKRAGKTATRTFDQIRNSGLIEAAEKSVSKSKPTQGFEILNNADRSDLSYEQIIVDHPEEFSDRALWYARKTLGLPNLSDKAPASAGTITQQRSEALLDWLWERREPQSGIIAPYENAEAAAAIGMQNMAQYGRTHGNVQSRIDYACFINSLPPLGLTASKPFEKAWDSSGLDWDYPAEEMQRAAQNWRWTEEQFALIRGSTKKLPGTAADPWKKAMSENLLGVRDWAFGLKSSELPAAEKEKRNPIWTRDELILALDFYIEHKDRMPNKTSAEVVQLSAEINALALRLGLTGSSTLRNANGVYMKLMNFRSHDPAYTSQGKSGLTRGNSEEQVIWDQFAADPEHLRRVADIIRDGLSVDTDLDLEADEPEVAEANEGRLVTRLHRTRERSRAIVQKKKAAFLKKHGQLFCEACGFNFSTKYGDRGAGFIECHHTRPLHTLQPHDKTKLEDLSLLCANCHRIVHVKAPWLSMEELRSLLNIEEGQH